MAKTLAAKLGLVPIPCFKCHGGGRQGFFGVASVPCGRCGGSGVDPNPTEEEAHRFANPTVYRADSGGDES